jgi:SHS family lactate transporter-like MFS transporter
MAAGHGVDEAQAPNPYDGTGTEYDTKAPHEGMSVGRYLATRIPTLKPPMLNVPNPIKLIMMLDRLQWAFFAVAFAAWTMGKSFSSRLVLRAVLTFCRRL